MTTTKKILSRDDWRCAYCQGRNGRAVQRDHFIKRRHLNRVSAAIERENPKYQVACCRFDNEAVGTRCFVPPSHVHLIPELMAMTGSVYGVYDGDPATLRKVLA